MKKFSNIFVTGGAGFIGSHIVDRLMDMGCFVRVVDNLSSGSLENVQSLFGHPRFEFVRGDLKDLAVARKGVNGVDAVFLAYRSFLEEGKVVEVYNVGSFDQVDVKRIAEIVTKEMGLQNVEFKLTGGVDGGRGWRGDVKTMLLSADKLLNLGWKPMHNSEEAVRLSCRELLRSVVGAM